LWDATRCPTRDKVFSDGGGLSFALVWRFIMDIIKGILSRIGIAEEKLDEVAQYLIRNDFDLDALKAFLVKSNFITEGQVEDTVLNELIQAVKTFRSEKFAPAMRDSVEDHVRTLDPGNDNSWINKRFRVRTLDPGNDNSWINKRFRKAQDKVREGLSSVSNKATWAILLAILAIILMLLGGYLYHVMYVEPGFKGQGDQIASLQESVATNKGEIAKKASNDDMNLVKAAIWYEDDEGKVRNRIQVAGNAVTKLRSDFTARTSSVDQTFEELRKGLEKRVTYYRMKKFVAGKTDALWTDQKLQDEQTKNLKREIESFHPDAFPVEPEPVEGDTDGDEPKDDGDGDGDGQVTITVGD